MFGALLSCPAVARGDRIAPYKYPRAVQFVDALPRTSTGKVQRFRLRQGADTGPAVNA